MYALPQVLKIRTDIPYTGNAFNVPEEIGCFSIIAQNEQMNIQYDDTMKKYYFRRQYRRQDKLDLSKDYNENFKINPFTDEKIDNVLNWIMNEKNFQPVMSEDCVDFVTSRRTISKLLCTPFCTGKKNQWRIYASKFRKTIYLIGMDSEEKIALESNPNETYLRKTTYYGKKFQQYLTTKDPKIEPDLTTKCYDSGMFCIIATNRIGDHKLLFRAEMDALKSDPKPGDTSQYVEIKTCHQEGLLHSYPYKPLKIWSECIPVGVRDIVCGFRSTSGILKNICDHKTENLPNYLKDGFTWSPEACFNFCNYFLNFLKENLRDDHKTVFRFDYTEEGKIYIRPEEDEKYRIVHDEFVKKFPLKESVSQSE